MTQHRVVLDTNIYRSNPRRDNLPFSALSRLCKADVVQLFIPYIVLREFQTYESTQCRKQLSALVSAARSLGNQLGTPEDLGAQLTQLITQLNAREAEIASRIEDYFLDWIHESKANVIDLNASQAKSAMEAYFVGGTPLKEPKARGDIPDALIFQAVRELAVSPLTFVSEDEKLRKACAEISNVTVFRSLPEFIESGDVQDEIKELDVVEKIDTIASAMERFEEVTFRFKSAVKYELGEALMWKKIFSRSIPDDNHEATISGYSEPDDIELDFGKVAYFGGGEFGIPFRTTLYVTGFYYIFKGDIYRLEGRSVSLSDQNNHYYEAEEQFEVAVDGLLRVICDREAIDLGDIGATIHDLSIDSLGVVRLVD